MLLEKLSINVGESTVMYIEMFDGKTPETNLKYGDCRWDESGKMLIWYGRDNTEMSGWVNSPWNESNYTGAILHMAANSKNNPQDVIYRIMNNDIDFNEAAYVAKQVESDDE